MIKNKKGFTLIELIIVIAVIAILAAVLIPTISNVTKDAAKTGAQSAVSNANTAMRIVFEKHNSDRCDQTTAHTTLETCPEVIAAEADNNCDITIGATAATGVAQIDGKTMLFYTANGDKLIGGVSKGYLIKNGVVEGDKSSNNVITTESGNDTTIAFAA